MHLVLPQRALSERVSTSCGRSSDEVVLPAGQRQQQVPSESEPVLPVPLPKVLWVASQHEPAVTEPDKVRDGDARWETGLIPAALRQEVLERDNSICRFCGSYAENPALHHVIYRSEGGRNRLDNLITTHWMYQPQCHERIHGRKRLWQPLGLQVIKNPGLTMLQLERWQRTRRRR